jgi:B-cell receptor-associated protein 31
MVTFCFLVFPLPHNVRKKVFGFLSESPIVAKVAYGLKISFMCATPRSTCLIRRLTLVIHRFVAILFADALQRMFRVTAESELAKQNGTAHAGGAQAENSFAARKF